MRLVYLWCFILLLFLDYARAGFMMRADSTASTQLRAANTYHHQYGRRHAFAAKDYETYIHTSALEYQPPPPFILHQAGFSSPRHAFHRSPGSTSTTATTTSADLLVSGPALAFIVVLTLGAFMF